MSSKGSRITLNKRIDAVTAAVELAGRLRLSDSASSKPWSIVAALRDSRINRASIRHWLDEILAAPLPGEGDRPWYIAIVRRHVARIEQAVGLQHDPRTAGALVHFGEPFDAFIAGVAAERAQETSSQETARESAHA